MRRHAEIAVILGIGEYGASASAGETIRTLALGSCVGVVLWDPRRKVAGMVHVALPDSSINPEKAKQLPGHFADMGVPALIAAMAEHGCDPRGRGLTVKLAGGARVLKMAAAFDIGKKNALAVKKHLWAKRLGPRAEDLGGSVSRTLEVDVDTGAVRVIFSNREVREL